MWNLISLDFPNCVRLIFLQFFRHLHNIDPIWINIVVAWLRCRTYKCLENWRKINRTATCSREGEDKEQEHLHFLRNHNTHRHRSCFFNSNYIPEVYCAYMAMFLLLQFFFLLLLLFAEQIFTRTIHLQMLPYLTKECHVIKRTYTHKHIPHYSTWLGYSNLFRNYATVMWVKYH